MSPLMFNTWWRAHLNLNSPAGLCTLPSVSWQQEAGGERSVCFPTRGSGEAGDSWSAWWTVWWICPRCLLGVARAEQHLMKCSESMQWGWCHSCPGKLRLREGNRLVPGYTSDMPDSRAWFLPSGFYSLAQQRSILEDRFWSICLPMGWRSQRQNLCCFHLSTPTAFATLGTWGLYWVNSWMNRSVSSRNSEIPAQVGEANRNAVVRHLRKGVVALACGSLQF